jgi:uncharacterized protein YxjI
MGLLRNRDSGTRKFRMREKAFAIGDDFWVEDDDGNKVFKVDGKAMRFRKTFHLQDPSGHDLAKIQEKKLTIRDTMTIERESFEATVRKRLIGIRDRYLVELDDGEAGYTAKGNFVDHEYEIERGGDKVAEVSKKWFRVRDSYGVAIDADVDPVLILAITVAIDALSHDAL